jgi:hypothetical protein
MRVLILMLRHVLRSRGAHIASEEEGRFKNCEEAPYSSLYLERQYSVHPRRIPNPTGHGLRTQQAQAVTVWVCRACKGSH